MNISRCSNLQLLIFMIISLLSKWSTPTFAYQNHKPPSPSRPTNSKEINARTSLPLPSTRKQFTTFLSTAITSSLLLSSDSSFVFTGGRANAFEGGVGGLGKTKPQTGVIYANPELVDNASIKIPGDYNAEILTPDGTTPVFLSFYAPWPMLKSQGIESRDLANAEASFVQVASIPEGYNGGSLKKLFFADSIFGQAGKFGAYGAPSDVKISKVKGEEVSGNSGSDVYLATFTILTPAMRESDRKAYISTKIVGDGVFMLVTGTTMGRFKGQEKLLKRVAESFECVEAPKSSLRR